MHQYPLFFCDIDLPFTLELKRSWREIGGLATWTLSSAKEGHGVSMLRDNNSSTFWQSAGETPHTLSLQFNREVEITRVDILINFRIDESYTPKRIQIKLGSCPATLLVVRDVEFTATEDQNCWWGIELTPAHALKLVNGLSDLSHNNLLPLPLGAFNPNAYLRAACMQIVILSTHQQGRDTHIRQVRVYGPIEGYEETDVNTFGGSRQINNLIGEETTYGLDLGEDTDAPTPTPNA